MTCQTSPDLNLDLLVKRVDRTIAQCRRFEEMAQVLSRWLDHWSTARLARWLNDQTLPIYERELALVALALNGDAGAGAIIDDYDIFAGNDDGQCSDHHLFYQIAKIEWRQRHCHRRAA